MYRVNAVIVKAQVSLKIMDYYLPGATTGDKANVTPLVDLSTTEWPMARYCDD